VRDALQQTHQPTTRAEKRGAGMNHEHYNPVPLNIVSTKKRWSKNPAFAEAYDAFADEFAALRHHADAMGCELHTTLAPKAATSRRSKAATS
jgi:hypothetical protein